MILLFRNLPSFMVSKGTRWMYGRYGHHDVPPGELSSFFAVRGTIDAVEDDIREVIERELEADPK